MPKEIASLGFDNAINNFETRIQLFSGISTKTKNFYTLFIQGLKAMHQVYPQLLHSNNVPYFGGGLSDTDKAGLFYVAATASFIMTGGMSAGIGFAVALICLVDELW